MPSTRDLRRRIKSIKNTSQITKAMQMVSATKMRKAQNQTLSARPYWQTLLQTVAKVSDKIHPEAHPLLNTNSSTKIGALVLSSDKGLCGSLNANVLRLIQNDEHLKGYEVTYYTVGKKGRDFLVRTGKSLEADFTNHEHISFSEAAQIRKLLVEVYTSGSVGKVYMVYPRFISTLRQEARIVQLLPITQEAIDVVLSTVGKVSTENETVTGDLLFEPNADQVLEFVLIHLLETRIYQALLETKASEHSARMMAMQNATDNAKELVTDLNLTYNQVRQDAITNELLEITSAGAALE